MARLWQQIRKGEQGQALPIVLILLVLGGLLLVPSLDYAATSLNAGRIVKQDMRGVYAADAGVEHVLWHLKDGIQPAVQLPENVNQMQVTMQTEVMGQYSLYYRRFVETESHYYYLGVNGVMGDVGGGTYQYTITVNYQHPDGSEGEEIEIETVGVKLPPGFSYQTGSADDFGGNLSTDEPNILDQPSNYMLHWTDVDDDELEYGDPAKTQSFYITGERGDEDGDAWVKFEDDDEDVAVNSEVVGTLYKITATATGDSSSTTVETYYLQPDEVDITGGNLELDEGEKYYGDAYYSGNILLKKNSILYGNAYGDNITVEDNATINGVAWAGANILLKIDATINSGACGDNVTVEENATINGSVWAGGDNVVLKDGAIIDGNVYTNGNVDLDPGATITGEIYPYDGCGLSLGTTLTLSWESN